MSNSDGNDIAAACCGLCCICCGEGFTSWMQITKCCPGSNNNGACCGPCCKASLGDDDDWVEKERAQRRRDKQARAKGGDPSVVDAQPTPRASMEAGQPQVVGRDETPQEADPPESTVGGEKAEGS